jgi:hypothetical protein
MHQPMVKHGCFVVAEDDSRDRLLTALHGMRVATPLRICELCTLLPVTGAAIVEMTDVNRQQTVCATDEVSDQLQTLQFTLGEGPGVEAVSSGRPVLVSDLREVPHTRWPVFAEAASRTPARALYSFPLQIGVISVGALELYRDQPGPLTTAQLAGALLCADVARWALLGLRAGTDPDAAEPQRWLTDPDLQRTEIHRATGMVMAQLEISAESALATLRAFAYSNDQALNDIAHQVVTRQLRFPQEDR